MNTKKDKFTKEDLIRHYESGMLLKDVQKLYGISDETLSSRNKFYGINPKDYTNAGKFNKLTREELINLYKSGMSLAAIGRKYHVSDGLIRDTNKRFGIDIKDYYEYRLGYDICIFSEIDTEEKAYWLGFLYADGNVRKEPSNATISIHLNAIDLDHIKKFKLFMKDTRPDSVIKFQSRIAPVSGKPQSMVYYQVCNQSMRNDLIKLGCVPAKSLILKFPDISIFKNSDLVYAFIRGYIDGDGCLGFYSNHAVISVRGTEDMLKGIIKYFPEFGSVYSEIDKKTGNTNYKISCFGLKAKKVATKLYEGSSIYLDRKYEKFATYFRLEKSSEKSGNIGEDCDVNTETTDGISQGSSAL